VKVAVTPRGTLKVQVFWVEKRKHETGLIAGTYVHGIFDNDQWRINYLNLIRVKKGIQILDKKTIPYKIKREAIINNLANQFKKHINIESLLN